MSDLLSDLNNYAICVRYGNDVSASSGVSSS